MNQIHDKEPASKERVLYLARLTVAAQRPEGRVYAGVRIHSALANLIRDKPLDALELLADHPDLGKYIGDVPQDWPYARYWPHVTQRFLKARRLLDEARKKREKEPDKAAQQLFEAVSRLLEDPCFGEPHVDLLERLERQDACLARYAIRKLRCKLRTSASSPKRKSNALCTGETQVIEKLDAETSKGKTVCGNRDRK